MYEQTHILYTATERLCYIICVYTQHSHTSVAKAKKRNLRPLTASDRVDNSQNVGKLFIYKGETR